MLANPKHEKFAQLVAKGESATAAYVKAGYKSDNAAGPATRLSKNVKIRERIVELSKAMSDFAVKATGIDKAWVMAALKKNYDRAMQEEPVLDRDGKETGEFVWAGTVANRACELIGKELGMFIDRKDVTVRSLDEFSDDELKRWMDEAAQKYPDMKYPETKGSIQ